jgi:hypothetical protein
MPETDTVSGPVVMVAGRVLRPAAVTTFEQDGYMVAEALAAGVFPVDPADPVGVVTRIMGSGRTHTLLAGALVEDGVPWSRAWADKMAQTIAKLTDPEEKAGVLSALGEVIAGFFVNAGRSFSTSPSVSPRAATSPRGTTDDAPTSGGDSAGEAPSISASGTVPSEPSPTTTA